MKKLLTIWQISRVTRFSNIIYAKNRLNKYLLNNILLNLPKCIGIALIQPQKSQIYYMLLIIPDHSEPSVRTLRATIPEHESHPSAVYSTVLLTWASIAHDCTAMRQISAFRPIAVATSLSCATHEKSLSRHKTAGSDRPEPWLRLHRTGGSAAP